MRYLIRIGPGSSPASFRTVFAAEGIEVLHPAPRCPRMNAYAECVARTTRTQCTHRMLIMGQRHLQRVLAGYIEHCNTGRAHRTLHLRARLMTRASSCMSSRPGPLRRCGIPAARKRSCRGTGAA